MYTDAAAAETDCYQGNTQGEKPSGRCGVETISLTGGAYSVTYAPCASE